MDKDIEADKATKVVVAVEGNAFEVEDEVLKPVVGDDAPIA